MRYIYLFILFLSTLSANAISREKLIEYAQSLNGLKKSELKTAIYELIDSPAVLSYGSGEEKTWWGFYYTDRIAETGECVNRYSARKFYFPAVNTGAAISGMNIEHSFPKSWWGGSSAPKAYKDLYNLYPSYMMKICEQASRFKDSYTQVIQVIQEKESQKKFKNGTKQYKRNNIMDYVLLKNLQDYGWSIEPPTSRKERKDELCLFDPDNKKTS